MMVKTCGYATGLGVAGLLLLGAARHNLAAEPQPLPEPLPEPLTLEYALSLASENSPELMAIDAERASARALEQEALADDGLMLSLEGRARWIDPPTLAADQSHDDHKYGLLVRKNLYDFGRSTALDEAARADRQAAEWRYLDALAQRRLRIMGDFFEVLRADLEFARDNEAMAVAFIELDRLRDRRELGQVSDIQLLESESNYQAVRQRRFQSEAKQRSSRARLALSLNRPGMLPSKLAIPNLAPGERTLPDYETLWQEVRANNALLQSLHKQLQAAQSRVDAAQAGMRPQINAELEGAEYSRETGSNDTWRAGVYVSVPLYDAGRRDSAVAKAQAGRYALQAKQAQHEQNLRQAVLELWLELDTLRYQADAVDALQDYRDLYLDRSRTVYELEVKADLGDAMVKLSEAQLASADVAFRIALAWERLDALLGKAKTAAVPDPEQ